uniref:Retinoblastoma-related protein n=1 Tax=Kalanchoe fedtschenkoi TaxID=63787 RepID=A0A7N0T4Y3_KALFE
MDKRLLLEQENSSDTVTCNPLDIVTCGFKRKHDVMSLASADAAPSPPCTPALVKVCKPASATMEMSPPPKAPSMTAAKWFQTVISPLPSTPNADLEIFLSSCEGNVKEEIMRRANIILGAIFPMSEAGELCVTGSLHIGSLIGNSWADDRRSEALKLYLRVLESICKSESQKLGGKNLSCLLANERFHRCMLACSAELVSARYMASSIAIPVFLESTGITAFDLTKVIETYIRHETSLPRELKRHLNSLEEQLLESMVWAKGSSLYNYLIAVRPSLAAEINRLGLLIEPMPSLDAITMRSNSSALVRKESQKRQKFETDEEMKSPTSVQKEECAASYDPISFTTPVKNRLRLLDGKLNPSAPSPLVQTAFISPRQVNSHCERNRHADAGIDILFSKVVKLAAVRISGLAERMKLSKQIRESVYSLFQGILSQRTNLFFNRHIDQIILCCFYGVAKVFKVNLTFKDIIDCYTKQAHSKSQIFRCVFVKWSSPQRNGTNGEDHIGIIKFYNEIFIPSVKPLLDEIGPLSESGLDLKTNKTEMFPVSPRMSRLGRLPDMSPKKISASHNVYLSPLRQAKKDVLISQTTKSYYACVGESTSAYQSPSKDLTAINRNLTGSHKAKIKLDYSKDAHLVSDSLVNSSLFLPDTLIKSEPKDQL